MSDDIIESLKRAGGDDGRPLGFGGPEVLRVGRIRRRRRRVYGGSVTALGVAVMAMAAVAVLPLSGDGEEPAGPPETLPLDRGPMSDAEVRRSLHDCTKNNDDLTTLYARKVDSSSGTMPAVLATARQPDGDLYTCGFGWTFRGGVQPSRPLDRAHPIESLTHQGVGTSLDGDWLGESGFFWVDDSVARVETRVGSEPWRSATPHNGVVFWSAWVEEGTYDADDEVWLRWRAFDTDGKRIDPALMPDEPQLIDPTGDSEVVAEYDEISGLLQRVGMDQFQSERGSLEGASARYGSRDDAGWASVKTYLGWSPWRSVTSVMVELSLSRPGTYTDSQLRARLGCGPEFECQRVDLGDQGWAWVGENGEGRIAVGHVQPDGEIAYVVIGADHPYYPNIADESDLTVDQAIDFVTDDRLDLPTP